MSKMNPSRDDFAALLDENFSASQPAEGSVVKGVVTSIDKDMATIDVGLKVEGRIALKEFGARAKDGSLKVGDTVEVYVERVENAMTAGGVSFLDRHIERYLAEPTHEGGDED